MSTEKRIYLDHAATTPLCPEACAAMEACLADAQGNASGIYESARRAKRHLENARLTVAELLGAAPQEVYFTSGGSESDNWALKGIMLLQSVRRHLIVSAIEHPAILNTCLFLERLGFEVTRVLPDSQGIIHPDAIRNALRPDTAMISVMWANNEIGTVQPIREIADIARETGIPMHSDAVQAAGTLPISVREAGVDLLSLSAHKFYGPKGIGALIIRESTRIEPLIHGGEQERGKRASTENVLGAVGMAAALKVAEQHRVQEASRLETLRDELLHRLVEGLPDIIVNGSMSSRLPGNLHITIPGVTDRVLLPSLDLNGIEASVGSACTAGSYIESHVLKAIGVSDQLLHSSLRLTLGRETDLAQIGEATRRIIDTVKNIRGFRHV